MERMAMNAEKRSEWFSSLAQKHGVSSDTIRQLYGAMVAGGGNQAQFNLPELGGMGQWSAGGMIMVGDMFNHALKSKVLDLCLDLSAAARTDAEAQPRFYQSQQQGDHAEHTFGRWYPHDLGIPASAGSQNSMRYAFFPSARRLALSDGNRTTIYDTDDHEITGFSQQQGTGQDVSFSSQHGRIALSTLRKVSEEAEPLRSLPVEKREENELRINKASAAARPKFESDDVIGKIERLAALHAKGILTDDEFATKKAELLSRI